jgi:hypothetical protein
MAAESEGQNNGDADGTFKTPDTQGTFFQAPVEESSLLQNLIDKNDKARAVFDQCKTALSGEDGKGEYKLEAIEKCVWEGRSPDIVGVKDQKDVIEEMKKLLPKGSSDEILDANPASQTQDTATKKLFDYYNENFQKEIFNMAMEDESGKNIFAGKTADHNLFFQLYETQVSRGILLAISEYCIDANPAQYKYFEIPQPTSSGDRTAIIEQRKRNMDKLGGGLKSANQDWGNCAVNIQNICHGVDFEQGNPPKLGRAKNPESKNRACMVTKFIKKSRQELIAKAAIDERLKDLELTFEESTKLTVIDDPSKLEKLVFEGSSKKKEKTVDEMVIVSSEEAVTTSGFEKATEEQLEDFKKCSEQNDQKECEKYFSKDREAAEKMVAEYRLRAEIVAEDLKSIETDTKKLQAYLKSQGYDDDKITELIGVDEQGKKDEKGKDIGGDGIPDIVAEIQRNYDEERKAVIADLSAKIDRRTSSTNGSFDMTKDADKIKKLEIELKDRPQRQKDLIRFTNFVSSLIGVKVVNSADEDNPNNILNTKALEVELAGLRNIQEDPESPEDYAKVQGLIESSQKILDENPSQSNSGESSKFEVDNLNSLLLKYQADPESKKEE